jgi:predicted Fe-Mo cluster-binding NifX family protein
MKIVITAKSDKIDQPFNPRFGRADYFIIVDSDTRVWEAFPNPAADARGGAGPRAVQFIADSGAEIAISGRFGPKAYSALEAAGIKAYLASDGTVSSVLQQFLDDQLEQAVGTTGPELHGTGH